MPKESRPARPTLTRRHTGRWHLGNLDQDTLTGLAFYLGRGLGGRIIRIRDQDHAEVNEAQLDGALRVLAALKAQRLAYS